MKTKIGFTILALIFLVKINLNAQDPNFHIFLCFGQSNMEGNPRIEAQDTININDRFQVMESLDCPNLDRTKGSWYIAEPPLCRCHTGLSPSDYFGRTMVNHLPDSIRVGVINVSVAGSKIEIFDEESYVEYLKDAPEWKIRMANEYGGNPYARLVEMAKLAQKDGVIKGMLLHQGESNVGDTLWPEKVKLVYDNLVKDLKLDPEDVPLLAGELVDAEQNGKCASMNEIIATLPNVIPNAHVISSQGCFGKPDQLHFTAEGVRMLGKRYGMTMLSLLGVEIDGE